MKGTEKQNKLPPIDATHAAKIIKDFIRIRVSESKAKGVIIGVSGGVDSAVVLSLANQALGPKRIFPIFLPTATTPSSDLKDVQDLCSNLKLKLNVIDIQEIVRKFADTIQQAEDSNSLEWMNFKPRIRQAVLYFFANKLNYLVCGAGNKSEIMIGYFTKFGDAAVDLLPIGDLYKTHVFQLAEYLNIPEIILKKAPSAGLAEGQTDEEEIGMPYSILDNILFSLERFYPNYSIAEFLGIPLSQVKKVQKMIYNSEHKRRGPIIFKLGIRTPNIDWRIPLVEPSEF